jgi:hypothetical protein
MIPAVQPTNERMVFSVASSRKAGVRYRVDALENMGGMRCACRDFVTRRQPAIDRGEPKLTRATLCKHCIRVIFHFSRELFADMAKSECEHR